MFVNCMTAWKAPYPIVPIFLLQITPSTSTCVYRAKSRNGNQKTGKFSALIRFPMQWICSTPGKRTSCSMPSLAISGECTTPGSPNLLRWHYVGKFLAALCREIPVEQQIDVVSTKHALYRTNACQPRPKCSLACKWLSSFGSAECGSIEQTRRRRGKGEDEPSTARAVCVQTQSSIVCSWAGTYNSKLTNWPKRWPTSRLAPRTPRPKSSSTQWKPPRARANTQ